MSAAEIAEVESLVNEAVWANYEVCAHEMGYPEALERGAMALFSEKYGDVVRVIEIPGVSMELCGGTHVRTTGQIGGFRVVSESGVAAGVRRLEAVTGREAYRRAQADRDALRELAATLRTREDNLLPRVQALQEEARDLARQLERARSESGADRVGELLAAAKAVDGARVVTGVIEVADGDEVRALGDRLRDQLGSGVAVLGTRTGERAALLAVATDDLIQRGVRADQVVRQVAAAVGGKGGGRPHMAQAGVSDPARLPDALERVEGVVRALLAGGAP